MVNRSSCDALLILCGILLCCAGGCERKPAPAPSPETAKTPSVEPTPPTPPAAEPPEDSTTDEDPPEPEPPLDPELLNRIGAGLIAASPASEGLGSKARTLAAGRMGRFVDLIDAGDEVVLWGAMPAGTSDRPPDGTLTRMVPMVLARAYLSLFVFSGTPETRTDGSLRTLEVPAKFRAELSPTEYPEVLWHSPEAWHSYTSTQSILLVFKDNHLLSVLRRLGQSPDGSPPAPARWDGNWRWPARDGRELPFASTFEWLLSEENPQRATLEEDYRILDKYFASGKCNTCHCPAPADGRPAVVILNYPFSAMAVRRTLASVIQGSHIPKGHAGLRAPVLSQQELVNIVNAASGFEGEADAALAYEAARRALPQAPNSEK